MLAWVFLMGCSGPPEPLPAVPATTSVAVHVEWLDVGARVEAPIAVVRDAPGGPLDRVVSDPDVTTFLNDRFHPIFVAAAHGGAGTVTFRDGCGCVLLGPLSPATPGAFIDAANAVMLDPRARRCLPSPPGRVCPSNAPSGL
jgi:hypothetical protein